MSFSPTQSAKGLLRLDPIPWVSPSRYRPLPACQQCPACASSAYRFPAGWTSRPELGQGKSGSGHHDIICLVHVNHRTFSPSTNASPFFISFTIKMLLRKICTSPAVSKIQLWFSFERKLHLTFHTSIMHLKVYRVTSQNMVREANTDCYEDLTLIPTDIVSMKLIENMNMSMTCPSASSTTRISSTMRRNSCGSMENVESSPPIVHETMRIIIDINICQGRVSYLRF